MADTGCWRVGEAGLGKQPEGAIWSKLLWDPCHRVFTGPACSWKFSLADSPYTALCIPYYSCPTIPRPGSLGSGEGALRWIPLPWQTPVTEASLEVGRLGEAREELNPRTYLGDREGRHLGA